MVRLMTQDRLLNHSRKECRLPIFGKRILVVLVVRVTTEFAFRVVSGSAFLMLMTGGIRRNSILSALIWQQQILCIMIWTVILGDCGGLTIRFVQELLQTRCSSI